MNVSIICYSVQIIELLSGNGHDESGIVDENIVDFWKGRFLDESKDQFSI